jgi:peptide/nickel transport system substrate-binding protein
MRMLRAALIVLLTSAAFATPPSDEPAHDTITFSGASRSVNRDGRPQRWQVAPDDALPGDFAEGDSLVLAWSADAHTLTPLIARDFYAARIHTEVLEPLVHMDHDPPFDWVPGLARSWQVSEDGKSITFHLFPNARFSDGKPVTADDVIFTWRTVMDPAIAAAHLRSGLDPVVESYAKVDAHTVRFTLREPYFDIVRLCGNWLPIVPEHVYRTFDASAFNGRIGDLCVGSGPWVLDSWERSRRIVLKRNENYWGPKAALREQVVVIRPGPLGQLQGFRAGEIDLIAPTPSQWRECVHAEWFEAKAATAFVRYSPQAGYVGMFYNTRRPLLADRRVRQALTMLIDREAIVAGLREGFGVIPTGPFHFAAEQCDKAVKPWPFDRERASKLLEEAGWTERGADGALERESASDVRERFVVSLLAPSGSDLHEGMQRLIHQSFEREGIRVNVEVLDWPMVQQRVSERTFDLVLMAQPGGPEVDAFPMWHSSTAIRGGGNLTGFHSPRADEIMEQARRTLDRPARLRLWHELHAILHEEQPCAFLLTSPTRYFLDGRFRNVQQHPLRLYPSAWYVPAGEQLR